MLTFILAPDFRHNPESGPIQVGTIVAHPLHPTKPLSPTPSPGPVLHELVDTDLKFNASKGSSLNLSLWANFLEMIGGESGTGSGKEVTTSYTMDRLETRWIDDPLDDDESLKRRLREPRVQAAIKAGMTGSSSIYLITGVKIARGLRVDTEGSRTGGGHLGVTGPPMDGFSAGAGITREKWNSKSKSYLVGDGRDVVFAYQLHLVKKGRGDEMRVNVFTPKEAFLHDEIPLEDDYKFVQGSLGALREVVEEEQMRFNLIEKQITIEGQQVSIITVSGV